MNNIKSDSLNIDSKTLYDFVFIGLGASNSLILLSLIKKDLLANKKIAIIESDSKKENDKTYCFWSFSEAPIVKDLSQIISHSYSRIEVKSISQGIEKQPYYFIKSIDLYEYTLNKSIEASIPIYRVSAQTILQVNENYAINTSEGVINSKFVFDSRTPIYSQLVSKEIHLHQSFYGFHIKSEKDVFRKDTFEMMNFDVDQSNYTQFIYTLPFASNESLVELTRFGIDKIDSAYAAIILNNEIKTKYGNYEIMADETGCIPMTNYWHPKNKLSGVLNTGANANLIKPSSGYGFKNMYEFAEIVSEKIKRKDLKNFNQIALKRKKRFRFYDSLLLTILKLWPYEGKRVFTRLFQKQKIHTIFTFLDEKTSIISEIKIFASLPIKPFLKALFLYIKK